MYLVSFIPVSHLQPPVSPFMLFWCFSLFSLPILTELMFSWVPCKDRSPGVRAKQGSPLKGVKKWEAVKFAPKDCKNLVEKVVLLLYVMLWPVAWICTFDQPETHLCCKDVFMGICRSYQRKNGQSRWDSAAG